MYCYLYITPFISRLLPAGWEENPVVPVFLCSTVYQVRRLLGRGERIPGSPLRQTQTPPRRITRPSVSSFMTLLVCDLRKQKNHTAFVDESKKKKKPIVDRLLGRPGLASTIATLAHLRHVRSLSIVGAYQRPATRTPLAAKPATHEPSAHCSAIEDIGSRLI